LKANPRRLARRAAAAGIPGIYVWEKNGLRAIPQEAQVICEDRGRARRPALNHATDSLRRRPSWLSHALDTFLA
jgi:hypothetical protein